ncbi:MAG: putative glycoside hydrolase [Methanobrevibacter sp.]|jgi:hypothetical protein|nr:putative glycoside hydrolase [Methanobrevibacter sp.]
MSKTIEYKYKKVSSSVTPKYNVKNPNKPSGTNVKVRISSKKYFSYAKSTSNFIKRYGKAPNYVKISKNKRMQYQTAIYLFSSVLSYNFLKKKLPSNRYISVKKSHSMNKYIPKFTRSSKTKSIPNHNSIWVRAEHMNSINLKKISESGIGNIFIHEVAINKYGKTKVIKWAKSAAQKGIKVHLWIQCFYEKGKWINPVNTKTKSYNYAYFNKILKKIKTYSKMNYIAGIQLDYLRYPGTAYKYRYSNGVTGEKAITKFVQKVYKVINTYNPNIIISASVMPETSSNSYYYGQNMPKIGKYLDIITPMIYKGNYGKNTAWIKSTTQWFVKNSGGARIWSGLQTYVSDNNPKALSTSSLHTDCLSAINGGAKGIALFRWGLTKLFNFLKL